MIIQQYQKEPVVSTEKKPTVVEQMAANAAQKAPPAPAVVEKAEEKAAAGESLNQREAKALEDQTALDNERGWRRIEWRPGVYKLQHIPTQHTVPDTEEGETVMRQVDNEYRASIAGR